MKKLSLKKRFFNHSALSLIVLMCFIALVVFFNFLEQIKKDAQEQLKLHIYNLLSVAEYRDDSIALPDILYLPRLNTLGSGIWAIALNNQEEVIWQSLSLDSSVKNLVLPTGLGEWQPGELLVNKDEYLTMAYGVQWNSGDKKNYFYLIVAENKDRYQQEVNELILFLVLGFGVVTMMLLLGQLFVLKKAFKPIALMASEIQALEDGDSEALSKNYPVELNGVARNINALIDKEKKQRERYRESMANLAHSLKTPMTVITSELNLYKDNLTMKAAIESVNNSIEYQLRRAVITGHSLISEVKEVPDIVQLVIEAISKVHAQKKINIKSNIDKNAVFYGDENDLIEVLGNLIDNAFKFCDEKIEISLASQDKSLFLIFEDDGVGLNNNDVNKIFKRGERLDQKVSGQGIGLAVVGDIVASYEGEINVSRSFLGGACFEIYFKNKGHNS